MPSRRDAATIEVPPQEEASMSATEERPVRFEPRTGTYRAAVVHDFTEPLVVEDVPRLVLEPGQIRVKLEASGLCHTDILPAHGDRPVKPSSPFTPGHEGVGIVEELGPDVTEVEVGDRVAMPWLGCACGVCDYCVSGWETLCLEQKNMGYSIDGGFGEHATAYAGDVVKVPEGIDPLHARR
jgi:propanol-preferring alcohol dehydrogenase